ncbi:MAG: hypothetical protein EBV86_18190, partial [Marivivens sp.]|nr:hypothetical protein [Marivivens sp.]NCW70454.1 hypothetical protein [Marivivens sp.]
QNIAVINGKPSIYGDAALALVKNHPACAGVSEWIEGKGDEQTAHCKVKRRYGDEIEETTRSFSVADAKRARLWNKQGPWSQYPDRMLAMRARGFAVRDAFPDALKGIITQEEAQDMPKEMTNVTPPANPLNAIEAAPEPQAEIVVEDTGEVIEASTEAPEAEQPAIEYQVVSARGQPVGNVMSSLDDFANEFLKMMVTYANAEKTASGKELSPRDRMTMLRQLRENNQDTLDQLAEADMQIVTDAYKKHLATLGASNNG